MLPIDNNKLIAMPSEQIGSVQAEADSDKTLDAIGGFESILINKLMDSMQESIGQWGFEKDSAFEHVNGIFNYYISDMLGKNDALSMQQQVYENLNQEINGAGKNMLDKKI